jgi:nitroreductase
VEIRELIEKTRSYRRFDNTAPLNRETLLDILDAARLTPSGANLQSIRYLPITAPDELAFVTEHARWAAYLTDWSGPRENEAPTAWVLLLSPAEGAAPSIDLGITAEAILLAATALGYGGCMFLSIDRPALAEKFGIGDEMRIDLAIALGKPKEEVRITEIREGDDLRYYRDENDRHVVPKLSLADRLYERKSR